MLGWPAPGSTHFCQFGPSFAAVSADRDAEGFEEDRRGSTFLAGRPAAMVRPPPTRPTSTPETGLPCVPSTFSGLATEAASA